MPAWTESNWDHERDLRKHDPRPTDPLPARFAMPLTTALEIAVLVRGVKDPREGAALVERYAQTVAAGARLDATNETAERILATIEAPLVRP